MGWGAGAGFFSEWARLKGRVCVHVCLCACTRASACTREGGRGRGAKKIPEKDLETRREWEGALGVVVAPAGGRGYYLHN